MHELFISADLGRWQAYYARKASKGFEAFAQKVHERDHFTCYYCGFQARDFQDLVNLDGNFSNNKIENVVTSCVFCTQCFFLETVGHNDFGGGTIIYLPEISQPDLNSMCHVLFCAMVNNTSYKVSAQSVYRNLKFRGQTVENHFGDGTSEPAVFGQLLIDYQMNAGKKDIVSEWVSKLRLLPSRTKFKKQIEHWAAAALEEMAQEQA